MSESHSQAAEQPKRQISLDVWAVALSLLTALLVRFDLIRNVKW